MPKNGLSVSARPYTFGSPGLSGPIAGRAIYDAPSGGNLLLVLPHATPRAIPGAGPADAGGAGYLSLVITAMQSYPDGTAYSGSISAGAVIGTCYDENEVLGRGSTVQGGSYVPAAINSSPLSAGVGLIINRGVLQAASTWA